VGGYLAVVTPFSEQILSRLFGPEFAVFTAIVIPIALGQLVRAERSFEKALELEPADTVARDGLAELRQIIKSRQRSN